MEDQVLEELDNNDETQVQENWSEGFESSPKNLGQFIQPDASNRISLSNIYCEKCHDSNKEMINEGLQDEISSIAEENYELCVSIPSSNVGIKINLSPSKNTRVLEMNDPPRAPQFDSSTFLLASSIILCSAQLLLLYRLARTIMFTVSPKSLKETRSVILSQQQFETKGKSKDDSESEDEQPIANDILHTFEPSHTHITSKVDEMEGKDVSEMIPENDDEPTVILFRNEMESSAFLSDSQILFDSSIITTNADIMDSQSTDSLPSDKSADGSHFVPELIGYGVDIQESLFQDPISFGLTTQVDVFQTELAALSGELQRSFDDISLQSVVGSTDTNTISPVTESASSPWLAVEDDWRGSESEEQTTVMETAVMEAEEQTTVVETAVMEAEEQTTVMETAVMEAEEQTTVMETTVMEAEEQTTVVETTVMEAEEQTTVMETAVVEAEEQTTVVETVVMEAEEQTTVVEAHDIEKDAMEVQRAVVELAEAEIAVMEAEVEIAEVEAELGTVLVEAETAVMGAIEETAVMEADNVAVEVAKAETTLEEAIIVVECEELYGDDFEVNDDEVEEEGSFDTYADSSTGDRLDMSASIEDDMGLRVPEGLYNVTAPAKDSVYMETGLVGFCEPLHTRSDSFTEGGDDAVDDSAVASTSKEVVVEVEDVHICLDETAEGSRVVIEDVQNNDEEDVGQKLRVELSAGDDKVMNRTGDAFELGEPHVLLHPHPHPFPHHHHYDHFYDEHIHYECPEADAVGEGVKFCYKSDSEVSDIEQEALDDDGEEDVGEEEIFTDGELDTTASAHITDTYQPHPLHKLNLKARRERPDSGRSGTSTNTNISTLTSTSGSHHYKRGTKRVKKEAAPRGWVRLESPAPVDTNIDDFRQDSRGFHTGDYEGHRVKTYIQNIRNGLNRLKASIVAGQLREVDSITSNQDRDGDVEGLGRNSFASRNLVDNERFTSATLSQLSRQQELLDIDKVPVGTESRVTSLEKNFYDFIRPPDLCDEIADSDTESSIQYGDTASDRFEGDDVEYPFQFDQPDSAQDEDAETESDLFRSLVQLEGILSHIKSLVNSPSDPSYTEGICNGRGEGERAFDSLDYRYDDDFPMDDGDDAAWDSGSLVISDSRLSTTCDSSLALTAHQQQEVLEFERYPESMRESLRNWLTEISEGHWTDFRGPVLLRHDIFDGHSYRIMKSDVGVDSLLRYDEGDPCVEQIRSLVREYKEEVNPDGPFYSLNSSSEEDFLRHLESFHVQQEIRHRVLVFAESLKRNRGLDAAGEEALVLRQELIRNPDVELKSESSNLDDYESDYEPDFYEPDDANPEESSVVLTENSCTFFDEIHDEETDAFEFQNPYFNKPELRRHDSVALSVVTDDSCVTFYESEDMSVTSVNGSMLDTLDLMHESRVVSVEEADCKTMVKGSEHLYTTSPSPGIGELTIDTIVVEGSSTNISVPREPLEGLTGISFSSDGARYRPITVTSGDDYDDDDAMVLDSPTTENSELSVYSFSNRPDIELFQVQMNSSLRSTSAKPDLFQLDVGTSDVSVPDMSLAQVPSTPEKDVSRTEPDAELKSHPVIHLDSDITTHIDPSRPSSLLGKNYKSPVSTGLSFSRKARYASLKSAYSEIAGVEARRIPSDWSPARLEHELRGLPLLSARHQTLFAEALSPPV